ncbi:tetratricopeptide repeat protein [Candidatus Desantisbacteria bacterium]|nr:tetratricopeptide repeat protein [Candidatus Desantisbacteria bacterium]
MKKIVVFILLFGSMTIFGFEQNIAEEYSKALFYFETSNLDLAMQWVDKSIEKNSENKNAYVLKGNIYIKQEKYKEAKECFFKAIFLDKKFVPALEAIFDLSIKENNYSEYKKLINDILPEINQKDENICKNFYKSGYEKLNNHKYKQAFGDFQKALQYDNQNIDVYLSLAKCYFALNEFNQALINYFQILGIFPENSSAIQGLADIYRSMNNFEYSEKYYNRALVILPENKHALTGIMELKKQKELYENSAENHYNLGKKLFDNGDIEKSLISFQKSIEINNNFLFSYIEIAKIYTQQEKYNLAEEIFNKVIELNKEFIPAYTGLSKLYYNMKEYQKAENIFKKVKNVDDDNEVQLQLDLIKNKLEQIHKILDAGDILYFNAYYEEALTKYTLIQEDYQGYIPIYIKIGSVYLAMDNLDNAKKFYNKALEFDKLYVPALVGLAKIYNKEKNVDMAYKYFKQILKLDSSNKEAYDFFKLKNDNSVISLHITGLSGSPNITRGELAALLVELMELDRKIANKGKGLIIIDIDEHWAKNQIKKAVENEIMELFPNRMFYPDRTISRADLAEYLKNVYNKLSNEKIKNRDFTKSAKISPYSDIESIHTNYNAIIINSLLGILPGFSDNTFRADANASGEEALKSINLLNNYINNNSYLN